MYYLTGIKRKYNQFPRQLWIVMIASLIFAIGSSMVWPFLNIYLQDKLGLPLRYITLLVSIRAISGIISSFFAGTWADKFGRRWVILISMGAGALYYYCLSLADVLWQFTVLLIFWGALDIFYPVGVNAMITDIVPDEDRLEAFSFYRMVVNTGFAVGPILGGLLASKNYNWMFYSASAGYFISFILLIFTISETLDKRQLIMPKKTEKTTYVDVMKDKLFISSIILSSLIFMGTSSVFGLLSLYANENFGFKENQVSIIFTVNAILCVILQAPAVRYSKMKNPFLLLIASSLLYAIGIGGYAMFPNIAWYCVCMTIMTVSEVVLSPTLTGITARLAPPDARGRYMSVLSLAHPLGNSIGPAFFGYLYEKLFPAAIWLGGGFFSLIAAMGFLLLYRTYGKSERLGLR